MMGKELSINDFKAIYFLGIGGIGMSALARYFNQQGKIVGGYDKTPTPLTHELQAEGIQIHFEDLGPSIPKSFQNIDETLIVITPAIPSNLGERLYFVHSGFTILKRAEVLGIITRSSMALTVAGTHGKTTTSTLLAHILQSSGIGCTAFLGGISSNYESNYLTHPSSPYTVIEADEFDRSFLQLNPFASIVTSVDPDHLDIYGDTAHFKEGFKQFVNQIDPRGFLVGHVDLGFTHTNLLTYSVDKKADYSGSNLRFENGTFLFDLITPTGIWKSVELGIPGIHNAENAIACIALSEQIGLTENQIRKALSSFKGVKRRFEYHVKTEQLVYIDDYAHHPTEIHALISSVRLLYPGKKITGIFQPHLFSRTRDFFDGFVQELSTLDNCILMPIYPAREEPISGVNSEALLSKITSSEKALFDPNQILEFLKNNTSEERVILTIGAGDIDRIVQPIKQILLG
jgi:UDP-N-acetylmuramate--alanine ligase